MTSPRPEITYRRCIRLEDFRLPVSIGIHDFEREAPQIVIVNVELELAESWSDPGDRIEHTIDYDFLREGILSLVRGRHFNLQETLCQEIMALCQTRQGLRRIRVSTRKPDVYPDCRSIGFEIEATLPPG